MGKKSLRSGGAPAPPETPLGLAHGAGGLGGRRPTPPPMISLMIFRRPGGRRKIIDDFLNDSINNFPPAGEQ